MSDRASLADRAVDALAAVSRMDETVTNEHDERHYIRSLKRHAEAIIMDALTRARELAYLGEQIQSDAARARAATPGGDKGRTEG
jgi:hypothetical protein